LILFINVLHSILQGRFATTEQYRLSLTMLTLEDESLFLIELI